MGRKAHQGGKQLCFACNVTVPSNGHGLFKQHTCPGAGTEVDKATLRANAWVSCPDHGTDYPLVWVLGPYSAYPQCNHPRCDSNAKAGRKPGPWRYQGKPKAGHVPQESANEQPSDDSPSEENENTERPVKPACKKAPPVMIDDTNHEATAALQALLGALTPKTTIDEDKLREIVSEAVDAKLAERVVTTLEVKDLDKGTRVEIDSSHPYLQRVIRLVKAGVHVYLWGPAGSGKTTAGQQAAHALERESEIDTLDPSTFRSMVQGYMTPQGEPVHTSFTRCYSSGKVYIADECDNAPGHVQTLFNSALANGHAPLAWGNVERSEGFAFIGTGNTPGRPTREFPDRRPMSAAFADRMYFVHWPLDEASERRWAGVNGHGNPIKVSKARPISAQAWVDWVQKLRDWAKSNAPTLMVTPRASLTGIKALELGEVPEMVADALIFRGADSELRTKALTAVVLP